MSGASSAPLRNIVRAQAAMEIRMRLRHGESLLLTIVIPLVLLVFFSSVDLIGTPGDPVDFVLPGVIALAIMSTAFTGQAIATAYERSYGVLKRLRATPLPRWGLLAAKTLAVVAVEVIQVALLVAAGVGLGWRGRPGALPFAVLLVLLGTICFSALGLLMAGTLRAEATLAAANGLYLLLVLGGGLVVPLAELPGAVRAVARLLPTAALADGLRAALNDGVADWGAAGLVAVWAVALAAAAVRWFRWE